MSDFGNKDHLPSAPESMEFQPEAQGFKESPPWGAVGRMFWILLVVSVVGGFAGGAGALVVLLACGVGALYVCGLSVVQLFERRFGAALATLVVGLITVSAAGFVGMAAYFRFSFQGFW